ncbi:MAG TPA: contact-dependent growth inhibition system immunity protein [Verrucomicrobiales bacterium]|nr:contact-dependent growth inhibition system immunity protein [Verrucomicrobiales bacterium]
MSRLTFQQLETLCAMQAQGGGDSSLEEWYASVRTKPFSSLTDGDIARAVRQKLFLEYIVQETIRRLRVDPLAGEKYDGELISALAGLKPAEWEALEVLSLVHGAWMGIVEAVRAECGDDPFLRAEVSKVSDALHEALMR